MKPRLILALAAGSVAIIINTLALKAADLERSTLLPIAEAVYQSFEEQPDRSGGS